MRGSTVLTVATGLLSTAQAIHLVERDATPDLPRLDIHRKHVADPVAHDLQRRASSKTVQETLDNELTLYFANVSLGTPAQKLQLHIDTGSSDLWTNDAGSSYCKGRDDPCYGGTYSANSSSTYKYVSSKFNITYADGSGATGDYATDVLSIGGVTLQNLQFGIGYQSGSQEGILGIGYTSNEVQVNTYGGQTYPNVPELMATSGVIQSNAYSLWLDDLEANTGSILFGGVDTDKFHGTLQTLPIQPEQGVYAEFLITLTGVSLSNDGSNVSLDSGDTPVVVLLDSGSSLTYLPDDLTTVLYQQVGAQYSSEEQTAFVPCSLADNTSTIDFTFSSPVISVPMSEMVINAGATSQATFKDGTPACIFGIAPAGQGGISVLGDTWIRSAYVVYDLANNEISLAQTNFNSTSSNILEIGTGANSVPQATGVTGAVSATATHTGGARIGGLPSTTGTSTGSSSAPTTKSAAVSIHVSYGVFAAVAAALFLVAV
ncbi:MAG: acid protease [Lasallia pustulata]|uniref:Probable aspartic-type endopeptidase OPSB n=1 Tax=Lasallia pustulata TaxID=136370 RepID=A0A5M8PE09_9LECA|nr:MAG: acid protease [Lasallia pustulata]